nr:hypothetical protein [uncultured bacterium]
MLGLSPDSLTLGGAHHPPPSSADLALALALRLALRLALGPPTSPSADRAPASPSASPRRSVCTVKRLGLCLSGGVVGPAAFIAAWVIGGIWMGADYSPVDDAISRLAAVGAETRWLMTGGFVVFGVALVAFGQALRARLDGPVWITATLTGLATLGVAATPLDWSDGVDRLHGAFAGFGYITLAATSLLGARAVWRDQAAANRRPLAVGGAIAGMVSTVALALTLTDLPTGFVQRLGLTASDLWIIVLAATMLDGRRITRRSTGQRVTKGA